MFSFFCKTLYNKFRIKRFKIFVLMPYVNILCVINNIRRSCIFSLKQEITSIFIRFQSKYKKL